jgi:hypothetical protein
VGVDAGSKSRSHSHKVKDPFREGWYGRPRKCGFDFVCDLARWRDFCLDQPLFFDVRPLCFRGLNLDF